MADKTMLFSLEILGWYLSGKQQSEEPWEQRLYLRLSSKKGAVLTLKSELYNPPPRHCYLLTFLES